MTALFNDTPFPAQLCRYTDKDGHQAVAAILKVTFALPQGGGQCRPDIDQAEILAVPEYYGDRGHSSIRMPADLGPPNPGTDVVFVGDAYAPSLRPVPEVVTRLRVGPLDKRVVVVGERKWTRTVVGSVISPPVPFARMPMVYERAFGGTPPSQLEASQPRLDDRNPVGTGYCARRADVQDMRLPNLEDPCHRIRSWRDHPAVAGLGAVDAHWRPRRERAGTMDDEWRRERAPLLPADFDPRFLSVASEGLWAREALAGPIEIELEHLCAEPRLRFLFPPLRVDTVFTEAGEALSVRASLRRLVIEPGAQRLMALWSAPHRLGKRPSALSSVEISLRWC